MDTGTIVSVVLGFLGGLWSVWKVLSAQIKKLEDRCARLEGDARVATAERLAAAAERAALRDGLKEQLGEVKTGLERLTFKLDNHMTDEPKAIREALRQEFAAALRPALMEIVGEIERRRA